MLERAQHHHLDFSITKKKIPLSYVFAFVGSLFCLYCIHILTPYVGDLRFLFLYPLFICVAWFLGPGPASLATTVVLCGVMYFFMPFSTLELFRLIFFTFNCTFIIWIIHRNKLNQHKLNETDQGLKKLVHMEEQLRDALTYRDEFLSLASHELKTPLTSLKLQSQIFQRNVSKNDPDAYSPEKVDRIVGQIDKQVGNLTKLVNDMLDISRIRKGKLELHKDVINVSNVLDTALDKLQTKPLDLALIKVVVQDDCEMFGDKNRIEQVITNILNNALRYGKGNPIEVFLLKKEKTVEIKVKDNGIGIPVEDIETIFIRFQFVDTTNETSGLGLGLYISKQIVETHNGQILVESTFGSGSEFTVVLPLALSTI